MSKKQFFVPYGPTGNLLESSIYNYPELPKNRHPDPRFDCEVAQWRPNDPFRAKLTYVSWSRGRSAVTVTMQDDAGHFYPFIGRYFFELVHLMRDGSIDGVWKVIKRGSTYGLDLVDEREI